MPTATGTIDAPQMRVALALLAVLALATPATAEVCHFGRPGTTISIAAHDEAAAVVTITNRLAERARSTPCVVTFDGLSVTVTYNPGPGREPDVFMVEPPRGYTAHPDWLLLDDDTEAEVLILEAGEGGV